MTTSPISWTWLNAEGCGRTRAAMTTSPISWTNWLNVAAYAANTVVTYVSLTGAFGATNSEPSDTHQTLVTPASWAFVICSPIFIWEGIFVVAQLFPRFRQSQVVSRVSPFWWALCAAQTAWALAFAQEQITLALLVMLGILVSLLGASWSTDGLQLGVAEYFLLRAPLSLQQSWVIAANVVSTNVHADAATASQETLLALAVLSYAAALAVATAFALADRSPDPLAGLVAASAFAAIPSGLGDLGKVSNLDRFDPSTWDAVTLGIISLAALALGVAAAALRASGWPGSKSGAGEDQGEPRLMVEP